VVMIFELMLQYQIVTIIQDMQSPTFKTWEMDSLSSMDVNSCAYIWATWSKVSNIITKVWKPMVKHLIMDPCLY
jgi:hypothetical protein